MVYRTFIMHYNLMLYQLRGGKNKKAYDFDMP